MGSCVGEIEGDERESVLIDVSVSRSYMYMRQLRSSLGAMWSQECHTDCAVYDEETDEASTDQSDNSMAEAGDGVYLASRQQRFGLVFSQGRSGLGRRGSGWSGSRRSRCFHLKSSSPSHGMDVT